MPTSPVALCGNLLGLGESFGVNVISPLVPACRVLMAAGLLGLLVQSPASAALGSVTVSETSGIYSFTVTNAEITTSPRPTNFTAVASPFQYKVDFFDAPSANKLGFGSSSYYLFQYDIDDAGFDFIRNLSGAGFLSGTFDPVNKPPLFSTMKVFDSGSIELEIFSTSPATVPCYMGLTIVGATGAGCSPYLNKLQLTFATGVTGKVVAGPPSITVNTLLADFGGSYSGTGSFSAGGGESLVNYIVSNSTPVPGPAPILGAAAAFRISRQIRRRIRP